jgi:hypothetical protein
MFRRSFIRNVHLFSTLLPTNLVKAPLLVNKEHFGKIESALTEAKCFVAPNTDASLRKAFALCEDVTKSKLSTVQKAFDDVLLDLRRELNKVPAGKTKDDPLRRLQIHECIMAAGFYQRAANPNVLHGEGTRFALHHFNFDMRRDAVITKALHDSILVDRQSTEQSEKLLTDLFLLERKLFGRYRFVATGGRRWLCLGVSLDEVKGIEELNRLLELPCVKEHGNFVQRKVDNEKELWYNVEIEPKEEPCFLTARNLQPKDHEAVWTLRVNKPIPPLTFWERVKERLLRYWVIWLTCWIIFFMVDEEIIALTSLIVLKWSATRNMKREAEAAGDSKIYIARSRG